MQESANTASVIFVAHMIVLTLLLGLGLGYACEHSHQFMDNMRQPYPDINIVGILQTGSAATAIFYGYSSVSCFARLDFSRDTGPMLYVQSSEASSVFLDLTPLPTTHPSQLLTLLTSTPDPALPPTHRPCSA